MELPRICVVLWLTAMHVFAMIFLYQVLSLWGFNLASFGSANVANAGEEGLNKTDLNVVKLIYVKFS